MKLLIITSLTDDKHEVSKLLQEAGISIFSVSETTGYKRNNGNPNALNNWFGSKNGEFDSLFFFSFTDAASADAAIEMITSRNQSDQSQFPIHAFVLPVESFSKI